MFVDDDLMEFLCKESNLNSNEDHFVNWFEFDLIEENFLFLIHPIFQYHEIDHQFDYNTMLMNHMYFHDLFLNKQNTNHYNEIKIINMLMMIKMNLTKQIIINIFKNNGKFSNTNKKKEILP